MTSDTNNTKNDIDYDWVVGVFDTDAENHSLCGDDTNVYNHAAEPTRDKKNCSEQTTITNHQDDEDENIMESLKVSRVERKRKREKQRRIDTNTQFNALADTIQKIEMENDGGVNTEEDVDSEVSNLDADNEADAKKLYNFYAKLWQIDGNFNNADFIKNKTNGGLDFDGLMNKLVEDPRDDDANKDNKKALCQSALNEFNNNRI